VDSYGEVFNYPGLYVADGSVMPGPVGPNPSLTIAAARGPLRAADYRIERDLNVMAERPFRSLMLAGGGIKVGYQAGCLQVLLDEAGLKFDHVDGASGGCFQRRDGLLRAERHANRR